MMKLDALAKKPRQRANPSANKTPSGVAISMSRPANFRLCCKAWIRVGSVQTECAGSAKYHLVRLKPCHVVTDRPSLKENCTATITGTIEMKR